MAKVCDYDSYAGEDYKRDFWEGKRAYEDAVERNAVSSLLPARGKWVIDIGGGFGRLTNIYSPRFENCILFDYAPSLLKQAREFHLQQGIKNVFYISGDLYKLPFRENVFDASLMIRVLHHVEDIGAAFSEVKRVLKNEAVYVLEFANKRNILEIARHFLGSSGMEPFRLSPARRPGLNFLNFHPLYVEDALKRRGFKIVKELAVSTFRHQYLKKLLGDRLLSKIDIFLQAPLGPLRLSPSIFVRASLHKEAANAASSELKEMLACPNCAGRLELFDDGFRCAPCGLDFPKLEEGIFDFRIR